MTQILLPAVNVTYSNRRRLEASGSGTWTMKAFELSWGQIPEMVRQSLVNH